MGSIDHKRVFSAPDSVFGHPQRVLFTSGLSHDDKVAVLRRWKHMLETLRAESAGKSGGTSGSDVSARLAAVRDALNVLRRQ